MLAPLAQEVDAKQIGVRKLVLFRDQLETFNEPLTVVHSPFLVTAVSSPHPRYFSPANLARLLPNPSPALTALSTEQTLFCLTFGGTATVLHADATLNPSFSIQKD